jgi:hypothetical protein
MTVAELIAKLQEMPQDMPVYRFGDYGDNSPVDDVDIGEILERDDSDLSIAHANRKTWTVKAVVIY